MKKNDKQTTVTKTEVKDQTKATTPATTKPEVAKKAGAVKPEPKSITLAQLASSYAKKKLAYDKLRGALTKRLESIKKGMDRLTNAAAQVEAKLASMVAPNGNQLIEPLAKELIGMFPGYTYRVTGPTGMLDAITISFIPANASEEDKLTGKGSKVLTILTKNKDGNLSIRDYSKTNPGFLPGSAGYESGLQYGSIPVPQDATVQFFAQYVK